MILQESPHDMHVFVCNHARKDGRGSCGDQWNASEIVADLKRLCKERNLSLRVSPSGCLGPCEKGPNIMVYPQKLWFHGVKSEDLPTIVDELGRQLQPSSASAQRRPTVD